MKKANVFDPWSTRVQAIYNGADVKPLLCKFYSQEVHFQGKKERETRKRHSLGDLESKSRGTENFPPKKRDRVFDKINISDKKEKFRNLEKEAKKASFSLLCFLVPSLCN